MAVFRFRLERLLEQRRREERDKQAVVATIERERLALEDRLKGRQRAFESVRSDLRSLLGVSRINARDESVSMADLRQQAAASHHLVADAQRLALALAGVHRRLDAARQELAAAAAARKAVEKLRERERGAFERAIAKKEQAEMDEIASTRAARRADEWTGG